MLSRKRPLARISAKTASVACIVVGALGVAAAPAGAATSTGVTPAVRATPDVIIVGGSQLSCSTTIHYTHSGTSLTAVGSVACNAVISKVVVYIMVDGKYAVFSATVKGTLADFEKTMTVPTGELVVSAADSISAQGVVLNSPWDTSVIG